MLMKLTTWVGFINIFAQLFRAHWMKSTHRLMTGQGDQMDCLKSCQLFGENSPFCRPFLNIYFFIE